MSYLTPVEYNEWVSLEDMIIIIDFLRIFLDIATPLHSLYWVLMELYASVLRSSYGK